MAAPRVGLRPDPAGAAGSFARLMAGWDGWMRARNFSPETNRIRLQSVGMFAAWLADRSVSSPVQVTRPMVEAYQIALTRHTKRDGTPMAISGQYQRMRGVASFFSWCHRKGHIPANPAADLELPRLFKSLPHHLTADEVGRLLAAADVTDPAGLRDRAVMELLYSTGLRRAEAARLRVDDLDPVRGLVRVTRGKGGKDRIVPIGARALHWIDRYAREVRSRWCVDHGDFTLFLVESGARMRPEVMGDRVKRLMLGVGITKPGSCHLFRHTFATHLLEAGCDMRLIQGMLGHAGPEMTARYAQVGARQLAAAHAVYHPAASGAGAEGSAAGGSPPVAGG
jgi:integrase/recombinase XerD